MRTFVTFRNLVMLLAIGFWAGSLTHCTDSEFGGAGGGSKAAEKKRKKKKEEPKEEEEKKDEQVIYDESGNPLDPGTYYDGGGEDPIREFEDAFEGSYLVNPIDPDRRDFFWSVTSVGLVRYYRLQDNKIVETREWTGLQGGRSGTRTYVLEGGSIVILKSGGHWHWIHPDETPQGVIPASAPNYFRGPTGGLDSDYRSCAVSYKKNRKRYLGIGYERGKFQEIPLLNKEPFSPQWSSVSMSANISGNKWGYSCYIDQENLIYYSQYFRIASRALNLNTMTAGGGKPVKGKAAGISYAISGDQSGNPLSSNGAYTMSYESHSDTIWTSGANLTISPAECVISGQNCDKEAVFNTVALGIKVGPMSAMGGGRVIGMVRSGGSSSAYMLSLKDEKNIAAGVDVTRLADAGGDPYMYTDFTGATLYETDINETFSFKKEFADKEHPAIGFAWALAKDESGDEWEDLSLEVRCYLAGGDEGSFEKIDDVRDAGKMTFIRSESCKGKKYDSVDIRVIQLDEADTLKKVDRVQITIY